MCNAYVQCLCAMPMCNAYVQCLCAYVSMILSKSWIHLRQPMCVRGASSSLVNTTNMDAYKKLGRTYSSSNSNNVLFITIVYFYSYLVL